MNTQDQPREEPGYRFLQEGEIIRQGDDFWWTFDRQWVESRACLGKDIDKKSVGHYRRKIT